ncbi:MAG: flagellar export chaperone FliS [Betaproteobacteria bacterium HGW-Betaproteobacteria-22]|nr:MAG: flagellar export chaperone FliS [Betaproteobacteria bacterium HGW-Betaproteobacteria-22]
MFGQYKQGVNGYAKVAAETGVMAASPVKLIVMLYEGAITACHGAVSCMQRHDIQNKGLLLSKAILIIESGLRLSLDKKAGGQIAENLDSLYAYMSSQLSQANIHNRPEKVHEVLKLLNELRAAWEAIDQNKATAHVVSQAKINQQGAGVNNKLAYLAKV